jgi:hypothetical protein
MSGMPDEAVPVLGTYLYCLARSQCLAVVQGLAELGMLGVDASHSVTALCEGEVVAVVGDVAVAEFSEENLQTLSWVASRAARHEAVVASVMDASPVLPVKFGTIFRSRSSLKQFLERHREDMLQALEQLRDKTEWSIKGYILEQDTKAIIAADDLEIQSLRAKLSCSPGARYLQQKQLDGKIDAALEAGLAQATHDLAQALALPAIASTALRLHASAITGRSERMVFNGSFLLSPETLPEFLAALSKQQDACQAIGLALELRGPWPPYNFCPDLSDTLA